MNEIYKRLRTLPSVKNLNGEVIREGDIPVAGGTYSDVWIGWWLDETKVAVKALREVRTTAQKAVRVSPLSLEQSGGCFNMCRYSRSLNEKSKCGPGWTTPISFDSWER